MRTRGRVAATTIVATLLLGGTAACGEDDRSPSSSDGGTTTISVDDTTTVIDVRTPEEYAAGHLDGAVNIDVTAADFDARVAELDPTGVYVVYCRSGSRSAQAAARLEQLGIDDVTDAGGLDAAATATGLSVVQ